MSIGTVGQSAKLNFREKDPQAEQNREDTHRMTNDRHLRIHADGTSESLEALQEMYGYPGGADPATALSGRDRRPGPEILEGKDRSSSPF